VNSKERFVAVMNFETPDRNLLWEMGYWPDTLERWYREGLERRKNRQGTPGTGIRGEASPHDESSTTRFRERDAHNVLGFDPGTRDLSRYFLRTCSKRPPSTSSIRMSMG
jgi:hypothetical protein